MPMQMPSRLTATDIVNLLQLSRRPLNADFIASRLGVSFFDLLSYLDALEADGIVRREGQMVQLTSPDNATPSDDPASSGPEPTASAG
jgi:hypothetical protein